MNSIRQETISINKLQVAIENLSTAYFNYESSKNALFVVASIKPSEYHSGLRLLDTQHRAILWKLRQIEKLPLSKKYEKEISQFKNIYLSINKTFYEVFDIFKQDEDYKKVNTFLQSIDLGSIRAYLR